jgi:hypothetical protein
VAIEVDAEKFWSRVDRRGPDECWLWTAARGKHGYGNFVGTNRHTYRAHRVAYELVKGEIPAGQMVLHRCDNPPCCNPSHLFTGTQSDNMQDMAAKGRHGGYVPHVRGEAHGMVKLNEVAVVEIRRRAAAGETHDELARAHGVSRRLVGRIVNRDRWGHVP